MYLIKFDSRPHSSHHHCVFLATRVELYEWTCPRQCIQKKTVSSFGTSSWTLSSFWWRQMKSPWIDQKSDQASASSSDSVGWDSPSSCSSPLRSSLLTVSYRLIVSSWNSWSFPDNFAVPSATWNTKSIFSPWGVNTSFALIPSIIWVAVESHFLSHVWRRVPLQFYSSRGPRNVQCLCEKIFAYSLTFLNSKNKSHRFLSLSDQYRWILTWRWSLFWISHVSFSHITLYPLMILQCRKSQNSPLEFNCFSIDRNNVCKRHLSFFHLTFPCCNCIFLDLHLHQAH